MSETIGRPVRVSSFSFYGKPIDEIANLVDEEGAKGTDIIVLPESWPDSEVHDLNAPPITRMAELAKKHNTYVVSPIYRKDGDSVYNTAVLLDRQGQVAFMYDKAYPCYEWDQFPNLKPGKDAPVYKADFGVIGFAICFDTNFPIVFDSMAAQGAELILWPSAYSAGTTLQSHALVNHFYIVSSTLGNDCLVFDINGEKILDESTPGVNITRITLDLDRGIYHSNWNTELKYKLLAVVMVYVFYLGCFSCL
jgi:predicted amidohydrolase